MVIKNLSPVGSIIPESKKFKVFQDNKPLCYLMLNDVMGGQYFDLPESELEPIYKFEIVDVYKGERWNDVAITHIDFLGLLFIGRK